MPDKWEYPWFAAWDLAFHCVALAHVDPAFAKYQLHPALPGVVPASQRSAARLRVGLRRRQPAGPGVGRARGVRDRRRPRLRLPESRSSTSCWSTSRGGSTGRTRAARTCSRAASSGWTTSGRWTARTCRSAARSQQSDATGWMAFYALAMATIARCPERSGRRPAADLVLKFLEHFAAIREAMRRAGLWDDADGLFYDRLVTPDGTAVPVKVRSMVGIIPLLAAVVIDEGMLDRVGHGRQAVRRFPRPTWAATTRRSSASSGCSAVSPETGGCCSRRRRHRPPASSCSRSSSTRTSSSRRTDCAPLSAYHRDHPYELDVEGMRADDRLRTRRVDHRHVRRQLQLARPDLVPAQLPGGQRAGALRPLLRRRLHRSSTRPARARSCRSTRSSRTCGIG